MNRGLTLVETIITVAMTVLAFAALTNLFLIFKSSLDHQNAVVAASGSAGTSLTAIESAVHSTDRVLASRVFTSGATFTSGTQTLVLELPAINSSGNTLPTTIKDYVAFYLVNGVLYQLTNAGVGSIRKSGTKQLSAYVNTLSYTYNDVDWTKVTRVTVSLSTRATVGHEVANGSLTEDIYLRNH